MQNSKKPDMKQKEAVLEYFKLIAAGKFQETLCFFASNCKTHNPFIKGNMKAMVDTQISASKGMPTHDAEFEVKHVLTEGDVVVAHTELLFNKSKPSEGGLRQVHIFRFEGDKIVEYWDVTQMVTKDMPNAAGAFSTKT